MVGRGGMGEEIMKGEIDGGRDGGMERGMERGAKGHIGGLEVDGGMK
jgi:hypothetical protein